MTSPHDTLLSEQLTYYNARASEYDEWFLRQGRFDHGPEANALWFAEAAQVADALDAMLISQASQTSQSPTSAGASDAGASDAGASDAPTATTAAGLAILELACGTGLWTERLLRHAASLTAVDGAPEMLALNRQRIARAQAAQAAQAAPPAPHPLLLPSPRGGGAGGEGGAPSQVEYTQANIFGWRPTRRYDLVFFSFWLSHVPPERFDAFWALVADCLAPNGRAFFVDSSYTETSTARDHQLEGPAATTLTRKLNDGQQYRVVKVFYEPAPLTTRLATLGWRADVQATPTYFVYGSATPI